MFRRHDKKFYNNLATEIDKFYSAFREIHNQEYIPAYLLITKTMGEFTPPELRKPRNIIDPNPHETLHRVEANIFNMIKNAHENQEIALKNELRFLFKKYLSLKEIEERRDCINKIAAHLYKYNKPSLIMIIFYKISSIVKSQ